jgi:transcriptional regulator with XRE-family HTH domain
VKYTLHPYPGRDVDTLQQRFGSIIRRRRTAIGLGQEALADKAGLHRTHVSLLERGKRMPSLEVVRKLAAALETTMASLMTELESVPASGARDRTAAGQAERPRRGRPKKLAQRG